VVKRRSLDDALTPEEQNFLESGKREKPVTRPKAKAKPITPKEEPPMARPAIKEDYTPRTSSPLPPLATEQAFTMAGAVSLNVRIEPEISTALLRASMDRKIRRLDPFTQRDIVAEALAAWLKAHGYLN
jgi:hypothetical protein